MRFHHSTRRGRNRLGQHSQHLASNSNRPTHHSTVSTSRWSQLGYCRDTNIHFNRRLPVEPPSTDENQFKSADSPGDESALRLPLVSLGDQLGKMKTRAASSPTNNSSQSKERRGDPSFLGANRKQQKPDLDDRLNKLSLKDLSPEAAGSKLRHQRSKQQRQHAVGVSEIGLVAAPKIDLESARERLIAQVEKHPFWSNKAAKRMQLTGLEERRIYIYELISFCERRELEWRYEPYKGGLIAAAAPFRRAELVAGSTKGLGNGCSWSQPTTPTGREPRPVAPAVHRGGGMGGHQHARVGPPPSWPATATSRGDSFWTGAVWSGASSPVGSGNSKRVSTAIGALTTPTKTEPAAATGARNGRVDLSGRSPIRRSLSSRSPTGRHSQLLPSPGAEHLQASGGAHRPPSTTASILLDQSIPSADFVWSIAAPAQVRPEPFSGCVHVCELPDSSFVKRCHGCQGRGKLKCTSCYGVGYEVCLSCSGKGTTRSLSSGSSSGWGGSHGARSGGYHSSDYHSSKNDRGGGGGLNSSYDNDCDSGGALASRWRSGAGEPGGIVGGGGDSAFGGAWVSESCHYCHGAGQKRCWVCGGKSYNFCLGCSGTGQLRCYLNLNISWLNHRDESILNNSDNIVPRDRLRLCSGQLCADETGGRLEPLARAQLDSVTGEPEESNQLHVASKKLLEKHWQTHGRHERLLKQRQKATQVECHVVGYEWKQRRGSFVIYGAERKVYIAKYPFKSFCSIT